MTFEDAQKAAEPYDWTVSRHKHYAEGDYWAEIFMGDGGQTFRCWGKTAAEALHLATEQLKLHLAGVRG